MIFPTPLRLAAALGAATLSSAHYTMLTPESIGFSDDQLGMAPCGGFKPDANAKPVTEFHVGGDAIGMSNGHSQSTWLFRGFTRDNAGNWTQLFPITLSSNLGNYCQPRVSVPADWAGKEGIIGIVGNAPDGMLYQCCAVRFVEGTGPAREACTNSTITVDFTDDPALTALLGPQNDGAGSGGSPSGTTPPTTGPSMSSTPSPSTTPNAAPALVAGLNAGLVMSVLITVGMAAVGGAWVGL